MVTSKMTIKGQIVVPSKIRRKYGMRKGTKVAFIEQQGKLLLQPLDKKYFEALAGVCGTTGEMLASLMEDKKRERDL
jgi:AbrB family looped-hinge helix DNA binding protein